ncbi:MAG: T9SS type A sorting domain-containing protein [Flavobacteriales bacterium]
MLLLVGLSSTSCAGQVVWTNFGGPEGTSIGASGFFRALDGRWGLNIIEPNGPMGYPNRFGLFDADGELEMFPCWSDTPWLYTSFWVFPNAETNQYLMLSGLTRPDYSVDGDVYVRTDHDLAIIDTTLVLMQNGPLPRAGDNMQAASGEIIRLLAVPENSSPESPTRLKWTRVSTTGEVLDVHLSEYGLHAPRAICETAEGFAVLFEYCLGLGPPGESKVLFFDDAFNYTSGFAVTNVNGLPIIPFTTDSVPLVTDMITTSDGKLVITGAFNPFTSSNTTPVLMKYDLSGVLEGRLFGLPPDRTCEYNTGYLAHTSDGGMLWPFHALTAGGFTQDHILKVNDNLELLGTVVLDGGVDTLVIFIDDVTETDNGDLLVAGYMRSGPGLITGGSYVARIAGITSQLLESPSASHISVAPNPGCQFVLRNADATPGNFVELFDAHGSLVLRVQMSDQTVEVNTMTWPSGLYHYRVIDGKARLIGSGKWVRE